MLTLITKEQVSEKLCVSVRTIQDWVADKKIPYVKMGRLIRFNETELNKWIEKRSIKTA